MKRQARPPRHTMSVDLRGDPQEVAERVYMYARRNTKNYADMRKLATSLLVKAARYRRMFDNKGE